MRKRVICLPDKIDEMGLAQAQATGVDVSSFYAGLLSDHLLNGQLPRSAAVSSESGSPEPIPGEDNVGFSSSKEVGGFIHDPNDPYRPVLDCEFGYFEEVGPGKGGYALMNNTGENLEDKPPTLGTFEKVGDGQGEYAMVIGFSHLNFDVAKVFPGFPIYSIRYAQEVVNEATKIPGVLASEYKQRNGQTIGIVFKPNFLMIEALLQRKSGIRVSLYGEPQRFKNRPSSLGRGRGRYSRIVVTSNEDLEKLLPLLRQAYELKLGPAPDIDFI
jgi:hypothetical protein